mmetsp:Transcript_11600/g.17627  ORF Transcript_11600/g.17627 Transcript_11600/m.17627 type:complete len:97 (-) Transcript_11600:230-520(-)
MIYEYLSDYEICLVISQGVLALHITVLHVLSIYIITPLKKYIPRNFDQPQMSRIQYPTVTAQHTTTMSSFLSPRESIAIPEGATIPPSWIVNFDSP